MLTYIYQPTNQVVRLFANDLRDWGSIPGQIKECPTLHLDVISIEKGAFGLLAIIYVNDLKLYICIWLFVCFVLQRINTFWVI